MGHEEAEEMRAVREMPMMMTARKTTIASAKVTMMWLVTVNEPGITR